MKKTLYISDLDGTLLAPDGTISPYTKDTLRRLIKKNLLFTIATARNLLALQRYINDLSITIPAIISNGIMIYNFSDNQCLDLQPFPLSYFPLFHMEPLLSGKSGFLYALKNNQLYLFHRPLKTPAESEYFSSREELYQNRCIECNNFTELPTGLIPLYIVYYGSHDEVKQIQGVINQIPELHSVLNKDVYCDYYFIDIFSSNASKEKAIKRLHAMIQADETVTFGDNYNDLGMLKQATRSYVPSNAVEEAKMIATGVIKGNNEDGVIRFIEQDFPGNIAN
ncbi:HAD family hydrolase [Lacrimispora sp.]|uniref:HAD family hydrolase n=1 Tax=Lacrimispora sp. TaxID=2719234 RepID=UPI002897E581|nr:HAD family hydrolase [Lacrimispora sp.]